MSKPEPTATRAEARQRAVSETISKIRRIEESEGITPGSLEKFEAELMKLAGRRELFVKEDFPHPTGTQTQTRYLVHEEPGERFTLYMNSLKPGMSTAPHDHSDSWAVVVAVEGEEENQLWDVFDEDPVAGKATLKPGSMITVRPGTGIALMPRQVHSIAIKGTQPTMHLHLYGQALEALGERRGFDLAKGTMFSFKSGGKTVGKG